MDTMTNLTMMTNLTILNLTFGQEGRGHDALECFATRVKSRCS